MKVELNHWAKVNHAEIELDGITVLAGPNGSGKSIFCRALMTLATLARRLPERIDKERQASFASEITKFIGDLFPDGMYYHPNHLQFLNHLTTHWFDLGDCNDPLQVFNEAVQPVLAAEVATPQTKERFMSLFPEWNKKLQEILHRPVNEYAELITKKAFDYAFSSQVFPLKKGKWSPSIQLKNDATTIASVSTSHQENGPQLPPLNLTLDKTILFRTFYLEPIHSLDSSNDKGLFFRDPEDRYSAGELFWYNFLTQDPRDLEQKLTLEETKQLNHVKEMLGEIVQVIHGKLELASQKLYFRDFDVNELIRLGNVASGAKSMAVIIRALELGKIRSGDLLIIDEPESNLHPEWQVDFAHFLVQLQAKLHIQILLSTHSPYFLLAIKRYVKDLKVQSKSHYYYFTESTEHKGMFDAEEVTDNLEKIFLTMYRPFDNLGI